MEQLFTSSVENALEAGLVQYDQVFALDGTKLNAYASIQKTKTKEELAKVREGILASVKEYFDRCEEVDSKEDETFGESDEKKDTIYKAQCFFIEKKITGYSRGLWPPHRGREISKIPFSYLPTIGYEGRSIDEYLNLLIKNNIKLLCDVRKNPIK